MREITIGLWGAALAGLAAADTSIHPSSVTLVGKATPQVQPVSVTITPSADTLVLQDTLWLHATVRDSNGTPMSGQQVTWASSRPSVVTVSGSGDSARIRAGPNLAQAVIRATVQNRSDSAWITVTRLFLIPATANAVVGQTIPFTADSKDSAGRSVHRPVFWSITNPSVAEITAASDPGAMVRGLKGGITQVVVATNRGGRATARLTVRDTTTPSGECAVRKPEWLWCDDFEADRLASYFEYDDARQRFRRDSSAGRNNSFGMRAAFGDGRRTAGALKVAVGRTPTGIPAADTARVARRELYWRVFVQHDTGWRADAGARLVQATSLVSRLGAQAMAAYVWSGNIRPQLIAADPATGTDAAGNVRTTRYDDFGNLRWLGPAYSRTAVLDSTHTSQWQCVEAFARLNTAGQSDALFRVWVNDTLEAERSGFNWVGGYRDYGLNAILIENVLSRPAPRDQERRYDNLIVSTARIGCSAGSR